MQLGFEAARRIYLFGGVNARRCLPSKAASNVRREDIQTAAILACPASSFHTLSTCS